MALTENEAKHLLRRVGFTVRQSEVDHFVGREPDDAVDEMVERRPSAPVPPEFAEDRLVWPGVREFRRWWLQRMLDAEWTAAGGATPSPLQEKMTLFWHGHFATNAAKVHHLATMWTQHEILRSNALGSFEDLLGAVCTNGALLAYLDNDKNTVRSLQENFARELMELYTIGPSEFGEADVIEMSRSWTGHGIVGWAGYVDASYQFRPQDHDNGNKTLFGSAPRNWNGPETLAIFTTGQKADATARFLLTKLWRTFINDAPDAAAIDSLVGSLPTPFNTSAALRRILLQDAFWSPTNRLSLVRTPIELGVDLLGRLDVDVAEAPLEYHLDFMRHTLFEPPNVAGWGTHGDWISTQHSWALGRFASALRPFASRHPQLADIADLPDARQGAQRIVEVFGLPDPSAETIRALETFWLEHQTKDRWSASQNAVVMAALSPEFCLA